MWCCSVFVSEEVNFSFRYWSVHFKQTFPRVLYQLVCCMQVEQRVPNMLNPHWLLQSWICEYKSPCRGRLVACLFSIWFLQMASAGYFRKAACDFNFSFCLGRGIIAVSGQATCTVVMSSMNSPWHRKLILRIYIKSGMGKLVNTLEMRINC